MIYDSLFDKYDNNPLKRANKLNTLGVMQYSIIISCDPKIRGFKRFSFKYSQIMKYQVERHHISIASLFHHLFFVSPHLASEVHSEIHFHSLPPPSLEKVVTERQDIHITEHFNNVQNFNELCCQNSDKKDFQGENFFESLHFSAFWFIGNGRKAEVSSSKTFIKEVFFVRNK